MNLPAPYSSAWWRQQPPKPLAQQVSLYSVLRDSSPEMTPRKRRILDRHLRMPLVVAEQIDRDMRRLGVLP
ncbi:hypothetical protein FNJ84_13685 [Paracoccus sp. M683]|uniref:hypothetical protein n=1 Tax=Paracoccus sp. M683 TaxID=2594268 RepID=UPI00117D1843|nr:hypothetical protein [Paracoccus sp. M683]TRW96323.1 hypothetical protein FNJ84_13685 [Paracoccus sp. M683]